MRKLEKKTASNKQGSYERIKIVYSTLDRNSENSVNDAQSTPYYEERYILVRCR
ncbi:MAG: hypothetical protein PHW04_13620 [Candidatus Wallbacteria bacterium]|nr:hypothetical protein [Candidatus Wallbacteria bacterium]